MLRYLLNKIRSYLVLLEAGSQLEIPLVLVQLVDAVVVLLAEGNQGGCVSEE